jgi:hypothetical protein
VVLHPVSDLATATAVDAAVLSVAPYTEWYHRPLQPAERHDPAGSCG